MSEIDFHRTRCGTKFYEGDIPRIADALESIAASMKILAKNKQAEQDESLLGEALPRQSITVEELKKELDRFKASVAWDNRHIHDGQ